MSKYLAFALLAALNLNAQNRMPVVVELFTSEGCSSCPPADQLLADLEAKQPVASADVIVLSEHVDYWNSGGWKDPYSSALFSNRQQHYASKFGSGEVYTPQAIVDGEYAVVGSRRHDLIDAITRSSKGPKGLLALSVEKLGGSLDVSARGEGTKDIWIAITEAKTVSHVAHGENGGRTLEHVGVVRLLTKLDKGHAQIPLNSAWGPNLRVVAFVQDSASGRISEAVQKEI